MRSRSAARSPAGSQRPVGRRRRRAGRRRSPAGRRRRRRRRPRDDGRVGGLMTSLRGAGRGRRPLAVDEQARHGFLGVTAGSVGRGWSGRAAASTAGCVTRPGSEAALVTPRVPSDRRRRHTTANSDPPPPNGTRRGPSDRRSPRIGPRTPTRRCPGTERVAGTGAGTSLGGAVHLLLSGPCRSRHRTRRISGGTPRRSTPTTSSSSAAAGTASRRPTTWRRTTGSRTSRSSSAAGSPAATWPATPTIIRSNYLWDESAAIYEHSLKLWERAGRGARLRPAVQPARRHQPRPQPARRARGPAAGQREPPQRRRRGVALARGRRSASARSSTSRPTSATRCSARRTSRAAASRKHDHVAWGYARAAERLGVDLIQGCEVTGIDVDDGRAVGVADRRAGRSRPGSVAIVAAGHSSVVAAMAGIRLPLQSHPLQALVSELLEPVHPTVVMSNTVHVYVEPGAQGRAGDGRRDRLVQLVRAARLVPRDRARRWRPRSSSSRSSPGRTCCGPGRASWTCRPDASPIIGLTPVRDLFVNCGWGTGGFKATPGVGLGAGPHDRRRARPHPLGAAVRAGAVHDRRAHRRARRRGGGALMCPVGVAAAVRPAAASRPSRIVEHARRHARLAVPTDHRVLRNGRRCTASELRGGRLLRLVERGARADQPDGGPSRRRLNSRTSPPPAGTPGLLPGRIGPRLGR